MKTRLMTAQDIPALAAIADATLFPCEMFAPMAEPALSGAADDIWLVALKGDGPVGFCFATREAMTETTWNMRALAVAPDHQRSGAGRALVADLEERLQALGARLLVVDTASDADQAPARAFYVAAGYQGAVSIPDFWGPDSDKVIYWKAFNLHF